MASKESIFNLALSALLLQRQVTNATTDKSNEANVLRANFDSAFRRTLQDLDLDSTSTIAPLAITAEQPIDQWAYAYTYPADCAFFRRIESGVQRDNRYTHIEKRVGIFGGVKVIFCNEPNAYAQYVSSTTPLTSLSASVELAVALNLAIMSTPLIVGKGARTLMEQLMQRYLMAKLDCQEQDRNESFSYSTDDEESEFVAERTS